MKNKRRWFYTLGFVVLTWQFNVLAGAFFVLIAVLFSDIFVTKIFFAKPNQLQKNLKEHERIARKGEKTKYFPTPYNKMKFPWLHRDD